MREGSKDRVRACALIRVSVDGFRAPKLMLLEGFLMPARGAPGLVSPAQPRPLPHSIKPLEGERNLSHASAMHHR
jgi:hypothetical protein